MKRKRFTYLKYLQTFLQLFIVYNFYAINLGQNDKNMCKLSLKEIIPRKGKNIEISAARFNRIWIGSGGNADLCASEIV